MAEQKKKRFVRLRDELTVKKFEYELKGYFRPLCNTKANRRCMTLILRFQELSGTNFRIS